MQKPLRRFSSSPYPEDIHHSLQCTLSSSPSAYALSNTNAIQPGKQAVFLPWHRWFTWTYDKALRDECGYRGSQPFVVH